MQRNPKQSKHVAFHVASHAHLEAAPSMRCAQLPHALTVCAAPPQTLTVPAAPPPCANCADGKAYHNRITSRIIRESTTNRMASCPSLVRINGLIRSSNNNTDCSWWRVGHMMLSASRTVYFWKYIDIGSACLSSQILLLQMLSWKSIANVLCCGEAWRE